MATTETAAIVERALDRADEWFASAPAFPHQVNLGSVVGFRSPAALSEHDLVLQTARFLNAEGVSWDDLHLEVSSSRWLFDAPHPATKLAKQWRVDIGIVSQEALLAADLPARTPGGFRFDAVLEFAYGGDWWMQPGASKYGFPQAFREKVVKDLQKVKGYLDTGVAAHGWIVVFEECDHGLDSVLGEPGSCRIRRIRLPA